MTAPTNPVQIRMPDLSPTDNEVTLVRWHVAVGEKVALGQPLLEVETAKAVMDVESVAAGVLTEVLAEPGAAVLIGAPIAVIAATPRPRAAAAQAAQATQAATIPAGAQPAARTAPRTRQERQERQNARGAVAPDAPSAAAPRQSFFARNRARQEGPTAIAPAHAAAAAAAIGAIPPIAAFTLTASAGAARLPVGGVLPEAVAAAALRAMASALGLTGTGVAVVGPDGAGRIIGGAKAAMLLVAVEGEGIESFRAASGLPVLAVSPPRLVVSAESPGGLAIAPRLPLALTADGAAIAPHHAARFLDSLVKELESL
jgi:pyruvate/2-oxoglutarate dehydrogenase complex dihydrolipoamide acyltransferase (E2) component